MMSQHSYGMVGYVNASDLLVQLLYEVLYTVYVLGK